MKSSKYCFIIFSLLVMPHFIAAQDWLPVRFGERYNYKRADEAIIHTTVWVDSIHLNSGDSIYYLNRVFKHISEDYVIKNYPNFLQRELHVTDDNFVFHSPETYVIPKDISVGEYWVFDTANNITASLSQIIADTILGQRDSIRVILLTEDADTVPDTLRMSKSHGITMFPDFQTPGVYFTLAGLEAEGLGMQMPKTREFYDFQVGDSFEFRDVHTWESSSHINVETTISSYKITNVQSDDSTMHYSKRGLWKKDEYDSGDEPPWHPTEYGTINEDKVINFYTSSWMNFYNGQAIRSYGGYYKPVYYVMSEQFDRPLKKQDLEEFCGDGDTLHYCVYQSVGKEEVAVGLGRVYYYYLEWDSYYNYSESETELKAFKKGDELYGSFSSLCSLLDPEIKAEMKILMSDTTITKNDTIVIATPDYFDSYNWSNGSDSNAIIISSADYDTGTYQLTVEIGYYGCFQTDTIEVIIKYPNQTPDPEKESSVSIEYYAPGSIIIVNRSKKELDYFLQLVDQCGKLIKKEHHYGLLPGSRRIHNINDLSEGFYIVRVRIANEVVTRKIVR